MTTFTLVRCFSCLEFWIASGFKISVWSVDDNDPVLLSTILLHVNLCHLYQVNPQEVRGFTTSGEILSWDISSRLLHPTSFTLATDFEMLDSPTLIQSTFPVMISNSCNKTKREEEWVEEGEKERYREGTLSPVVFSEVLRSNIENKE